MAFNTVLINKGQGGLGRPLDGIDYISALLFYSASLPSGFNSSNRVKTIFSVADAMTLGITNTHIGETKSTATELVTTKFAAGDTYALTCATIDSVNPINAIAVAGTVTLCSFTGVTADAVSTTTSAARIAAEINNGTLIHGFTASPSTATVTITAAPGQGIFLNSGTPYVRTTTGAFAGTLTQNVVAGIASEIDILYYHIFEIFRRNPKCKLYVGVYATADVGTFNSISLMQIIANGEINLTAIYDKSAAFSTANCNAIQGVLNALEAAYMPISSVLFAAELSGTSDLTGYSTNLKILSDQYVSVIIGQDGAAAGFKLFKATGKSITNVGEALGTLSLSAVNESWAWLGKFQVSSIELDTVAFSNGQLWSALSDGARVNLDTLGYSLLRKVPGLSGTFHNNPYTAIAATSDYSRIPNNRVILKAIASIRALYLPETGRDFKINSDGTLSNDVIGYFKGLGNQALNVMKSNGELSDFGIIINPAQNFASTNIIYVTVQLQPTPTADFITVNIGFVQQITS